MRGAGFFRELGYVADDGDPIVDAVGRLPGARKEQVLTYLAGGTVIEDVLLITEDVLDEARPPIGALQLLSDGEWVWPSDLAHYVELYDCDVPAPFHEHMARRAWTPPAAGSLDVAALRAAFFHDEEDGDA